MRILYHHRVGSTDGGEAVHIRELIKAFRSLGHEVVVSGHVDIESDGPSTVMRRALKVRHTLPSVLGELAEVALNAWTFLVLLALYIRHKPDLIYERANLFSVAAAALRKITGCPLLVEVNAPLAQERAHYGRLTLTGFAGWLESVTWRSADYTLPVSQTLAQILEKAGVPRERIAVVPNAVRPANFVTHSSAKSELGLDGRIVLGFLGYPREWNRLDRVIRLLHDEAFSQTHLLVVGDGSLLPQLGSLAKELEVQSRISFTGAVAHERVAYFVSAFDIALQPGVTPYACPLKLVEYMALGRAILAPDQVNVRELLEHEHSALLFQPDNEESFRAALLRLCSDPDLRGRLGATALERAQSRNATWEKNAARIVLLSEELQALKDVSGGNR